MSSISGASPAAHPPMLKIELLGGLTLQVATAPLVPSDDAGRLLALLAISRARPVEVSFLAASLWPGSDDSAAQARLHHTLTDLRRTLGPAASRLRPSGEQSWQLDLEPSDRLDLAEFEAAAQSSDVRTLDYAISLYRGPLLEEIADRWIVSERERLEAIYHDILERCIEASQASTSAARNIAAERDTSKPPSADSDTGTDRYTASLPATPTRFFGRIAEVTALSRLLTTEPGGDLGVLVTLIGTGGAGKTRLAIETARTLARTHFVGGVTFLSLSELVTADLAPLALARMLGVPLSGTPSLVERLATYFAGRSPCLILVDNCEHMLARRKSAGNIAATGDVTLPGFIDDLRKHLPPQVAILATSRSPLHIEGERRFPLHPLPLMTDGKSPRSSDGTISPDSVALFWDRAREANRGSVEYGSADSAAIPDICRMLDGLPLAIEIAASWASVLSPRQIRLRLEKQRDVLVARRASPVERHNSLDAVLEWSCELLTPDQMLVFSCLSVFRGSWNVEAVESICLAACAETDTPPPAILRVFSDLLDRSLIAASVEREVGADTGTDAEDEAGEGTRFRLLETVREFAAEKLAQDPALRHAVHRSHSAYYAGIATSAAEAMRGEKQPEAMRVLDCEINNLRAAMDWYLTDGDSLPRLFELCSDLASYWLIRGSLVEGYGRMSAALEKAVGAPSSVAKARLLAAAGANAWQRADYPAARRHNEEARDMARVHGEMGLLAAVIGSLANVTYYEGDRVGALPLYEESLALAREIGDETRIGVALGNLGVYAEQLGDYSRAITMFEEQLQIRRRLGDPGRIALTLANLATSLNSLGRFEESAAAFCEAESIYRSLGYRTHLSYVLRMRAILARDAGDIPTARVLLREAAILEYEGELKFDLFETLTEWIRLDSQISGQEERAARLIGAVEVSDLPQAHTDKRLAEAREYCVAALGQATAQDAVYRGRLLSLGEAVALLTAENG